MTGLEAAIGIFGFALVIYGVGFGTGNWWLAAASAGFLMWWKP